MLVIKKVDENNKQSIIESIKSDVIKHVFAFYDIQHEPEKTITYAAFENEKLKGYILIYTALDFPSVILECEEDTAETLIAYSPENHFIMHVQPNLLSIIQRKFPQAKHYDENWMLVKKGQANFFKSTLAIRLRTEDDASRLAVLLSTREEHPRGTVSRYMNMISNMPIYGIYVNGQLVSYAGSFIQLPQVWMIGGVYTHPDYRSKGYATLATSAVTEEALKNAEAAALFVRSDNYPAIKVYEKIGYKTIGEKLWVDVGTGLKP
jgi:ribosomal protein S18 acetylase RimI-like enzyme